MNKTAPFFQSHAFYFILGILLGVIAGFFAHALCAISGQASRDEERWEELIKESLRQPFEKGGLIGKVDSFPIIKGKPGRD